MSVRDRLSVHRPDRAPLRLEPAEYVLRQLVRAHGPDSRLWPFEVGAHLHRIARGQARLTRQVSELLDAMRSAGWHLVMQQGTLEDGCRFRWQRDLARPQLPLDLSEVRS